MSSQAILTVNQFNARLSSVVKKSERRSVSDSTAFLREQINGVKVYLFEHHASAAYVLDDGTVALRVRVACVVCKRERPRAPRRITVYVTQSPEDGSWSQACSLSGDEIADLRTDAFMCGPHATEKFGFGQPAKEEVGGATR